MAPPELQSYTIDLDSNQLQLTFTEAITTFNLSAITLQPQMNSSSIMSQTHTLTGSMPTPTILVKDVFADAIHTTADYIAEWEEHTIRRLLALDTICIWPWEILSRMTDRVVELLVSAAK